MRILVYTLAALAFTGCWEIALNGEQLFTTNGHLFSVIAAAICWVSAGIATIWLVRH